MLEDAGSGPGVEEYKVEARDREQHRGDGNQADFGRVCDGLDRGNDLGGGSLLQLPAAGMRAGARAEDNKIYSTF